MNGILKKILSVALLVLIFGCSEQYRNHGYIPSDEELSSVSVSQDDKNSVKRRGGMWNIGPKWAMFTSAKNINSSEVKTCEI